MLTHHNVQYEAVSTLEAAGLAEERQTQISYLPLAHIAERILGVYGPQMQGSHQYCIADPAELLATLGEVHPTAFFGVPAGVGEDPDRDRPPSWPRTPTPTT